MSETTTPPAIGRVPAYRVSYRASWSAAWTEALYFYPESIQLSAGPSMSRALIVDNYGTIKREDSTAFANYDPADLKNTFIRIETVNDPGSPTVYTPIFYGYAPAEELRPYKAKGGQAAGDYELTAYGLDYLLDVSPVAFSVAHDAAPGDQGDTGTPQPAGISRVIPFNDRYTYGLSPVGNRSEDKVSADAESGAPGYYVFSDENFAWTARDICEYILAIFGDPRLTFTLSGQQTILDNVIPSSFDPDLMTPREILNSMIDRRRGAGWRVYVNPSTEAVSIQIFSLLGTDVIEGAITIPANTSQKSINLDTLSDLTTSVNLSIETVTQYDQIVARGARIKTVFSIHKEMTATDGSISGGLLAAWTSDEQTDYDSADDDGRDSDALRHVYTTFTLPRNAQLSRNANPLALTDGTVNFNVQANMRAWGYTFLRTLPLIKSWADEQVLPEYREPFAFVKDPTTERYHYADRLNTVDFPSMTLRMLDSQPGFELVGYYNHILGVTRFSGDSSHPALFNYDDLYVTVCCETDSHVFYRVDLSSPVYNRLTIDVPDAELWVLSKGTATDVYPDGTLQIEPVSSVIRTDADRLKGIAAVARAWYGVRRGSLALSLAEVNTDYSVGDYITNTLSGGYTETVQSVVSQITYDCRSQSTTIQTAYEELDFQRLDR